MSRFFYIVSLALAPFLFLVLNSAAQDVGHTVKKQQESLDRQEILIELQSIRHRLDRLEKLLTRSDEKAKQADNAKSAVRTKAVEKDGLRIFHEAPVGTLARRAQIPMGNGHHEIAEVPPELKGRNYLQRGGYQGNTSFEILESQTVFVAFYGSDWGGGGNPSGNWLPEIVSKQQLKEQGWEEFGTLPVTHSIPEYKNEKPWIVFKRQCRVGEKFKLRNHKYQAPVLIWGAADDAAQLSRAQKKTIALIRSEIRGQIKRLEELERTLVATVIDSQLTPQRALATRAVAPISDLGMFGRAKVAGRDAGILFNYEHGKVFNPDPVRSRVDGDFVLTLHGRLQVPRDMVVKVWHAGGGVNGDVNTLFVNDRKISSVGDDRKKHTVIELKLDEGAHTVRWELTGGTFRHSLLKFADSASGELLPLGIFKENLPDLPVKEVVRVGTDRRGWPIPKDW